MAGRALWERALAGAIHSSIPILLPQRERVESKGSQICPGYYFWWEKTQQQCLCLDRMDTVPSRGAEPRLHHVAATTTTWNREKASCGVALTKTSGRQSSLLEVVVRFYVR